MVGCIALATYVQWLGLRACPSRRLYPARVTRIAYRLTHTRPTERSAHITTPLVRLHVGIRRGRPACWTTAEDANGGGVSYSMSYPNPTSLPWRGSSMSDRPVRLQGSPLPRRSGAAYIHRFIHRHNRWCMACVPIPYYRPFHHTSDVRQPIQARRSRRYMRPCALQMAAHPCP